MKYKIWNKQDSLYTPAGEVFTADEYIEKFAGWAKIPGIKCVVADAPINCSVFMEFEVMKEHYKSAGANITDGMSDEEVLDAISIYEATPVEMEPDSQERIAAALEFQNLMSL